MSTFFIVLGILVVVNFLLLQFSCNKTIESDPDEE